MYSVQGSSLTVDMELEPKGILWEKERVTLANTLARFASLYQSENALNVGNFAMLNRKRPKMRGI